MKRSTLVPSIVAVAAVGFMQPVRADEAPEPDVLSGPQLAVAQEHPENEARRERERERDHDRDREHRDQHARRERGGEHADRPHADRSERAPRPARITHELNELRNELERVQHALAEMREHEREAPEELRHSAEVLRRRIHELEDVQARLERGLARGRGNRFAPDGPPRPRGRQLQPGPEGMRRRGGPGPMGPDGPDRGFEMFNDLFPDQARELRELRRRNPREFMEHMRRLVPEMMELRSLRERDPEAFEHVVHERRLEHRAGQLAEEARRAEGEHREEHVNALRDVLNELFETRMHHRDTRIEQMEHELEKLRHEQEQRRDRRDELIQRRLEEMIGEVLDF